MCSANENMKKFCPLVLFIAKILIWMIGLFMILGSLAIDITPLLAGAGVAGIAVALAAQDIIGNIFSGFMLMQTCRLTKATGYLSAETMVR